MAPAIKEKVFNLEGVEYLYNVIVPNQLEIPAFITEYDMTVSIRTEPVFREGFWKNDINLPNFQVNGLRYFQPESPT